MSEANVPTKAGWYWCGKQIYEVVGGGRCFAIGVEVPLKVENVARIHGTWGARIPTSAQIEAFEEMRDEKPTYEDRGVMRCGYCHHDVAMGCGDDCPHQRAQHKEDET